MIEFTRCRGILVEGVRIANSPGWTLHGHGCDHLRIEGAVIERVRLANLVAVTDGGWPATRAIEIVALDCPNIFKSLLAPDHPHFGVDRPLRRGPKNPGCASDAKKVGRRRSAIPIRLDDGRVVPW